MGFGRSQLLFYFVRVYIEDQYVRVELVEGKYYSIRSGEGKVVNFDGAWNYKDTFRPSKGNEQFMKQYKLCVIKKLTSALS